MERTRVIEILNGMHYKPGYTFIAHPVETDDGRDVMCQVRANAYDSSKQYAPHYDCEVILDLSFALKSREVTGPTNLACRVMECLVQHEVHEAREFLRFEEIGMEAPFHPHNPHGALFWARLAEMTDEEVRVHPPLDA